MTRYAFAVVCAVLTLTGISVGGTVAPGVRVTSQSSSSTVIEFTAPAAEIIQVHIGDQSFSAVCLQGCDASITEVGKPKVPTAAVLLAIPTGAEPTLNIVSVETETLQCARVVPVQPETLREDTEAQPVMDGLCYKQDAWYPGTLADVAEPAVWRDLQVAGV
ncbi:MAG: hypothetical protein NTX53_19535, partial [candidate division WOR-3 bacterium]|nr:hypothetical protein [candidate division WOR-3 bacterium]